MYYLQKKTEKQKNGLQKTIIVYTLFKCIDYDYDNDN